MLTFKEFLAESSQWLDPNIEVVFMAKGHEHNEKLAKVVSDDDALHVTIKFGDGTIISNVLKKDLRMVSAKNESGEYKVYMIDKELWLAHGEGSGTTSQVNNMNSFLTNKSGDKNYDSIVDRITKKFVTYNEPQMIKKSSDKMTTYSLYYLPAYKHFDVRQGKMDIWGGTIKPFSTLYMLVVEGEKYNIVQFFTTRNEATAYIKSLL